MSGHREKSPTMRVTLTREVRMRGDHEQQAPMWSYISPDQRIPPDHPLRPIRALVDAVLHDLSPRFSRLYAKTGRPSVAPERLLRALLLQVLYSIRSERQLMEQLDYNLLYRWFVGLNMDDPIWDVSVFTKNRQRLLDGEVAEAFFDAVLAQARGRELLSNEHFTVDGTLIQAWAGLKSFQRRTCRRRPRTIPAIRLIVLEASQLLARGAALHPRPSEPVGTLACLAATAGRLPHDLRRS